MNTRIEKDFYFHAALHFSGEFYINTYDLTLSMLIETECPREQQVAVDRLTHYLKSCLNDSIFVYALDADAIMKYHAAGIKVCEIPEEPWDQVVGMVLLTKLNAIMENKIRITDMVLGSSMSEGVRYSMVSEEAEHTLAGNFWWNNSSTAINNDTVYLDRNVVKLFHDDEWNSLGLGWKEKTELDMA